MSSRLTRLWLVLVPALILTLVVDQFGRSVFPGADIYARTGLYAGVPDAPSYSMTTFLGNIVFAQSIYVSEYGLNKPLWSLAYEFWFYVMFPALLTVFWRGGGLRLRVAGAVVFALSALVAGPKVMVLFPAWLVGACVAGWKEQISSAVSSLSVSALKTLRLASVLATLGAMITTHQLALPSEYGAWFIAIVTAGMVSVFVLDLPWTGSLGRGLERVSSIAHFSYSLYATHMPIVAILSALLVPTRSERWTLDGAHAVGGLLVVALLAAFAFLFSRVTEQRTEAVRTWIGRWNIRSWVSL